MMQTMTIYRAASKINKSGGVKTHQLLFDVCPLQAVTLVPMCAVRLVASLVIDACKQCVRRFERLCKA